MINRRNIVWQVPLILLLTFPLWKVPVGNFLSPKGGYDPGFSKRKHNRHNFVLENVNILQSQNGKKTTDIRAERAYSGKHPDNYSLDNVDADIIGADGLITNVKSRKGQYNTKSKKLKLTSNVVVYRPSDNFKLFTELLVYYGSTRMITCPGDTRLLGDSAEIKGTSLNYDIERGAYSVGGRVYCTFEGFGKP